jgi:thymidylate synthase
MKKMKHVKVVAFDCTDAWAKELSAIREHGDKFIVGYGSEQTETIKLNTTIEIEHPENRPLLPDKAPCDMKYLNEYFATYLWMPKDESNTSSYTYGDRLRLPIDQIDMAIERFINEPNDRQVTLVIRRPEDIFKIQVNNDADFTAKNDPETGLPLRHDPPCLTIIDLEIIDNKLHMTAYFRSWDAYAGLCANIAGLQMFNEQLVKEINGTGRYPFGTLETGKLILHSKNCHIYQRQYKLVEELFGAKTTRTLKVKKDAEA